MSRVAFVIASFVILISAGQCLAQYDERLHCDGTPHNGENPNTEQIGDTSSDNACHGEPGDLGPCTISSGGVLSSVTCLVIDKPLNQPDIERCSAISDCGGAGDILCGGNNFEAFGGTDPETGKGFVQCQDGNTLVRTDCS